MTKISLINIYHLTELQISFSCDDYFSGLLSSQLWNLQHSIVNYSHHAVYSITRTYLTAEVCTL